MTSQDLDQRRGKRTASLIVALPNDQKMIAPVNRPHAVGIEVGKYGPLSGKHRCRSPTPRQQCTPIHTHQGSGAAAIVAAPARLSVTA
jgi:hypothetical protein